MRIASWCVAAALLSAGNAHAVDGFAVEAGNGDATDMARIGIQWNWKKRWFQGASWHLGGYWDLQLGYWRGHSAAGGNNTITDLGLTPVFRLQQNDLKGLYAEAAIGFHLLSKTAINADRKFGSSFQFGDHVGAGYRFGTKGEFDVSYRYQHLSNGGIQQPNQGISFNQIRFQYHF
ncbi:MAG: acyloxyacyl hydrolase [Betaproteobacteria bacterium]|nr:acyloxyacyl hydrolase [Betaproteobacteria bacterium]